MSQNSAMKYSFRIINIPVTTLALIVPLMEPAPSIYTTVISFTI